ncbi:DUF2937 family protein [Rhodobacteraceae bacterium D3-12]|nr:DUF2937 family protein [Rhodobacteraceae bacterium D3-12]
MLLKALTLAGGIAGAAGLSQAPEFSQQYMQRLGGAVDELERFVAEFDADATAVGLSRAAALESLSNGGAMGAKRAETMGHTLARYEHMSGELAEMRGAGAFTRSYRVARFSDKEIAANTWGAFRPAVPLTVEGAIFAGIGLLGGLALIGGALAVIRAAFARRKPAERGSLAATSA